MNPARRLAWGRGFRTNLAMLALALIGASALATAWVARRDLGDSGLLVGLVTAQVMLLILVAILVRRSHGDVHKNRVLNLQLNARLVDERTLARTDGLTGLLNSRAFMEELVRERARSQRSGQTLTLAYIDLDQFKKVNDMLGHVEGDQLLAGVAQVIKDSTRAGDVASRVGGDEFAVLFHSTCSEQVIEIARRISLGVERLTAVRFSPPLGASVGLFEVASDAELSVREIVSRADEAMYKAKAAGRQGGVGRVGGYVALCDELRPNNLIFTSPEDAYEARLEVGENISTVEQMMERNNVEGSWKQIKGQFQSKWTKLTKDDLEGAHGKFDLLAVALEKRYGLTKAVAERDLDAFITGMEQPKLADIPPQAATANGDAPRTVS